MYDHAPKRTVESSTPSPVPPKKKVLAAPPKFQLNSWEDETLSRVFNVTLNVGDVNLNLVGRRIDFYQKEAAERSGYDIVWLKELAEELRSEGGGTHF